MPVSLGAQGEAYERKHEWRVTLGYRRLTADEWFVGTEDRSDLAPFGVSPIIKQHTVVAGISFAVSNQLSLRVSVPFSTGTLARVWPDSATHSQAASGVGDISVVANAWILDPRAHTDGNISIGLGVKTPTGKHNSRSTIYRASGSAPFAADPSIQMGDGGWGIILQADAFRRVLDRAYAYASGSYTSNPKARTDVEPAPGYGTTWSVPDSYSGRLGMAYSLWEDQGVSVSLGARLDGLPVHDILGSGDNAARRPGYVIYADPGIALSRGRDNFTLSVPLRLRAERLESDWERQKNLRAGGAFAKYLIFAGYTRRL
jgi:hypothetical protein